MDLNNEFRSYRATTRSNRKSKVTIEICVDSHDSHGQR